MERDLAKVKAEQRHVLCFASRVDYEVEVVDRLEIFAKFVICARPKPPYGEVSGCFVCELI